MTKRDLLRGAVGLVSLLAIIAGIWGLLGWAWALIAAGLPGAGFYLWTEARELRAAAPDEGGF